MQKLVSSIVVLILFGISGTTLADDSVVLSRVQAKSLISKSFYAKNPVILPSGQEVTAQYQAYISASAVPQSDGGEFSDLDQLRSHVRARYCDFGDHAWNQVFLHRKELQNHRQLLEGVNLAELTWSRPLTVGVSYYVQDDRKVENISCRD